MNDCCVFKKIDLYIADNSEGENEYVCKVTRTVEQAAELIEAALNTYEK